MTDRPSVDLPKATDGTVSVAAVAGRFLFYPLATAFLIGWILVIGRGVLLPIVTGVLIAFIVGAAMDLSGRSPILGRTPAFLRGAVLLTIFVVGCVAFGEYLTREGATLAANLPDDMNDLKTQIAALPLPASTLSWLNGLAGTIPAQISATWLVPLLVQVGSVIEGLLLGCIYAAFILFERAWMPSRIASVFPDNERRIRVSAVLAEANRRIGRYLAAKAGLSLLLGLTTMLVLLIFGTKHIILLGILTFAFGFVPYFGAVVATVLPATLALAAGTAPSVVLLLFGALVAVHTIVLVAVEPLILSRTFDLSPLAVLISLAIWSALWGIAGVILAVPLTSVVLIVMDEFQVTRPVAKLAARRIE